MPISSEEKELLDKYSIINLEPELPGFARTAALVDQLDLVITVDTAITHVAGALGKLTWTLLSANPDWRWLESGDSTLWYPNHRLYRRKESDSDWSNVVEKIKQELSKIIDVK
jgi:ADP-heptose:LPS heptosyltransferase